jgi:hypothetical protein
MPSILMTPSVGASVGGSMDASRSPPPPPPLPVGLPPPPSLPQSAEATSKIVQEATKKKSPRTDLRKVPSIIAIRQAELIKRQAAMVSPFLTSSAHRTRCGRPPLAPHAFASSRG